MYPIRRGTIIIIVREIERGRGRGGGTNGTSHIGDEGGKVLDGLVHIHHMSPIAFRHHWSSPGRDRRGHLSQSLFLRQWAEGGRRPT